MLVFYEDRARFRETVGLGDLCRRLVDLGAGLVDLVAGLGLALAEPLMRDMASRAIGVGGVSVSGAVARHTSVASISSSCLVIARPSKRDFVTAGDIIMLNTVAGSTSVLTSPRPMALPIISNQCGRALQYHPIINSLKAG